MWENVALRLEGSLVVLEPLQPRHEEGLFEAARDPRIWQYLPFDAGGTHNPGESPPAFRSWFEAALAVSEDGNEAAFATLDAGSGEPIGSTRYLALRPAHRGLEIGWTWLAASYWGTGANVEAKLLMLEHAFGSLRCVRARRVQDRRAQRAVPGSSRGAPSALRGHLPQAHDPGRRPLPRLGLLQHRRRRVARSQSEPRAAARDIGPQASPSASSARSHQPLTSAFTRMLAQSPGPYQPT
jgi:N-acetyltransferase